MRIRVIVPITSPAIAEVTWKQYVAYARADALISVACLEQGPESIESLYEDSLAAPGIISAAIQAERDGVEAVIIDCMADPGLEAARHAVSIPVVGAAQASMLLASMLSHRFSVVSTASRDAYPNALLALRYGLAESYASTRYVDIPVLDLRSDPDRLLEALVEESKRAIQLDGAHSIVFGCTGMRGLASRVEQELRKAGCDAIVVDPSHAALKWAEMLVDLQLTHSQRTYPQPGAQLLPVHQKLAGQTAPELPGRSANKPHIHVMVPVVQGYRPDNWLAETELQYASYARPGVRLTAEAINEGPQMIETHYHIAMAVPGMLRLARQAERRGVNALIIDCMSDPSLNAAREAVSIPVVGPAQTSAFLAASLAHRFSILSTRSDMSHKFVNQVQEYGLAGKLASVQPVGLSVQQVESDPEAMFQGLLQAGEQAITRDGAHLLIPGCTGMIGIAPRLQSALEERGYCVPVIEPPAAAVKLAEVLCDMGLAQSKITYPTPPRKSLPGYKDLEFET